MRSLALVLCLTLGAPLAAEAQEEEDPAPPSGETAPTDAPATPPPAPTPAPPPSPPPPAPPPSSAPPPTTPGSSSTIRTVTSPPPAGSSSSTITTITSNGSPPASSPSAPMTLSQRPGLTLTPELAARWRRGRALYTAGSLIGLGGSALTLASTIVAGVTGYPCDPNSLVHQLNPNDSCNPNNPMFEPPSPTDAAPMLAYVGSSASALGFVLSASGLGYQHYLLSQMGGDLGRGVFAAGTSLGLLGFVSVGASYFFGLTDYLAPHDQGVAILTTTIAGTALCLLGGLLYTIDSSRLNKAWHRLFLTF